MRARRGGRRAAMSILATMPMLLLLDAALSNCPITPDVPCPPAPLPPHYYSCTANMT
jgi:hypothetical protein